MDPTTAPGDKAASLHLSDEELEVARDKLICPRSRAAKENWETNFTFSLKWFPLQEAGQEAPPTAQHRVFSSQKVLLRDGS